MHVSFSLFKIRHFNPISCGGVRSGPLQFLSYCKKLIDLKFLTFPRKLFYTFLSYRKKFLGPSIIKNLTVFDNRNLFHAFYLS